MNLPKNLQQNFQSQDLFCEDISEYVAELQLHMALQARNLVPSFPEGKTSDRTSGEISPTSGEISPNAVNSSANSSDTRVQLLCETQANIEKLISRQEILSCRL